MLLSFRSAALKLWMHHTICHLGSSKPGPVMYFGVTGGHIHRPTSFTERKSKQPLGILPADKLVSYRSNLEVNKVCLQRKSYTSVRKPTCFPTFTLKANSFRF